MTKTCTDCVYRSEHPFLGSQCRRYPSPINVSQDHWCGEHVAKVAEAPKPKETTDVPTPKAAPKRASKSRSSRAAKA